MQIKSIGLILLFSIILYFFQRVFLGISGPGLLGVVMLISMALVFVSASKNIIYEIRHSKKYEFGLALVLSGFAFLPPDTSSVYLNLYNFIIGFFLFLGFYITARLGFEKLKK